MFDRGIRKIFSKQEKCCNVRNFIIFFDTKKGVYHSADPHIYNMISIIKKD